MGWERKGCFVSQGIAKPDVEKGGEIFKFELKSTTQRIKNWHPISNNASSQIALSPSESTSGHFFTPPRGDGSGHFLLYICGGFVLEACSSPTICSTDQRHPSPKFLTETRVNVGKFHSEEAFQKMMGRFYCVLILKRILSLRIAKNWNRRMLWYYN